MVLLVCDVPSFNPVTICCKQVNPHFNNQRDNIINIPIFFLVVKQNMHTFTYFNVVEYDDTQLKKTKLFG